MLHYYHGGYVVLIQPTRLEHLKLWQVQFYIGRRGHSVQKGKIFTFPSDTFVHRHQAVNRCIELANAIIDGGMEGYTPIDA
jgi:hypothetical protein